MAEAREERPGALHPGRIVLEPLALLLDHSAQASAGVKAAFMLRRLKFYGNALVELDRVLAVPGHYGLRGLPQLRGLLPHGFHRAIEHGRQVQLSLVTVVIVIDHHRLRISSGVASGGHHVGGSGAQGGAWA